MNINGKILKLVSAVCTGLLIVIVMEWLIAQYSENRLLKSIESSAPSNASTDRLPEVDLEAKPEESYVDLVSRPLFLKGRKPVEEVSAENEKEQAGNGTFDWRLDGIYTGRNGLSALLSRSREAGASPVPAADSAPSASGPKVKPDNYRKVSENEDVDGWRLVQIKTDRVVFELGGESKELVLRKPKPKDLPPEKEKNQDPQQAQRHARQPQARTKDAERQDEAGRRRSNRGQPVDSESEPAVDESENGENEE
ncbi:hypothetical protein [Methylomicrobium album]|uniref:Type II secretion system protein GspC N-terminal domain-containing protein n=1 Tax=Methylomicrobium album BG8 TaxID=686340 RepID=H8GIF9_METAL|nr:hypothetical protein [Methylomicrobium album]EIC31471.1 hypothetical protein Metal_3829 [Methylomicrobium album BG8]